MFEKLQELKMVFNGGTSIVTFIEGSKDSIVWVADLNLSTSRLSLPYPKNDMFHHTMISDFWNAKENGIDFYAQTYSFEEKNAYFNYIFSENKQMPDEAKMWILATKNFAQSVALTKNAGITISSFTGKLLSVEQNSILKRIAKVFEQAYIRFLDLQKAEAQTREAQIEAALERVRAQTMAMHNSVDVGKCIVKMFSELTALGVDEGTRFGIGILNHDNENNQLWTASKDGEEVNMHIGNLDMTSHPLLKSARRAWKGQVSLHKYVLEGEDLLNYYQMLNNAPDYKYRIAIEKLPEREFHYGFVFDYGFFYAFSPREFQPDLIHTVQRFSSLFGQTYRRYLDLVTAEGQAREAQIEVALERVRSRTMAMQHSEELAEVMSVLCKGILNLGIHSEELETCYITTFDENKPIGEIYLTYSNGDLIPQPFQIGYDEAPLFKQLFTEWKNGNSFIVSHLFGDALIQHFGFLFSHVPASITEVRVSATAQLPSETFTHALYFSQGYLAIVTRKVVPEYHEVFKRFGSTLQQAYTRFLDLQKAEAQAELARQNLILIQNEKQRAEDALIELKSTQTQLIQREKMASLGELTAGIAHEIQNPLNFVNNFSEVSTELIGELKEEAQAGRTDDVLAIADDLTQNLEKITLHGQRASNIVKGMLEHSRTSTGERQSTDINALANEYLRLAYQGLRAKDKGFNCTLETHFGELVGEVLLIPQEIGRVLLNLFANAFYAVRQQQTLLGEAYKPTVSVTTSRTDGQAIITVRDNGMGMSEAVTAKIFQPFFTTKPTGQGTGLGLSLSYDIVTKGHGGTVEVESKEGEGTTFLIKLPF